MNMSQFAKEVGANHTRVSLWESGKGAPSTEYWLRLSALAASRDPDAAMFFWEQTGLGPEHLASIATTFIRTGETKMGVLISEAEEVLRGKVGRQASLEELGDVALVAPYPEGRWKDASARPLPVPARFVASKGTTYYVEAKPDMVRHRQCGLSAGDLVVFDASSEASPTLATLYGRAVVAYVPTLVPSINSEATIDQDMTPLAFLANRRPEGGGLFLGRVDVRHGLSVSRAGVAAYGPYQGGNVELLVELGFFSMRDLKISVCRPKEEGLAPGQLPMMRQFQIESAIARKTLEGLSGLRVPQDCEILGRFIALFSGEAKTKK
jgi:hypothetical protein